MSPTFLKKASPHARQTAAGIAATISEILEDAERRGIDAVRQWSRKVDDWDPPSYVVPDHEFDVAAAALSDDLKRHLAFAQDQVRRFATAQRGRIRSRWPYPASGLEKAPSAHQQHLIRSYGRTSSPHRPAPLCAACASTASISTNRCCVAVVMTASS